MYTSYKSAVKAAIKAAKQTNRDRYVVYDGNGEYDHCNEYDMDTFYTGARPMAYVFADGEVEQ